MDKVISRRSLTLALTLLTIACGGGLLAEQPPPAGPPAATIWYLGHCGYAVRTPEHLLIFDYIELEESPTDRGLDLGFVDPGEIAGEQVVVFVTHSHVDHYDEVIHSWQETIPDIRYCFGWQIEKELPYHSLPAPRAFLELPDLTVHTVNSHHSGVPEVAYLVQVDGLTIFHGGDYQGRMSQALEHQVVEDMAYLRSKVDRVDLLFLGAWTGEPYLEILRGLPHRVVFPMHDRKREERYLTFASELNDLGFVEPVICPVQRGDRFLYENGRVTQTD